MLGPMRLLVDGMNVIGTRADGWWRDRDAAMARLVDRLERWSAASGDDVTVVFERKPRPPIRSPVVEVAHAPKPGPNAADHEIVRRVRADTAPRSIRVVTSDHVLGDLVRGLGATVEPSASFRDRIESV
jgi:predicted RNA-binding protein with PIN domain